MKKLFDLQTGKYLELGRDWLDGNDYILRVEHTKNSNHINILPTQTDKNTDIISSSFQCILHKNTTHELNAKWNGLFKGCIYGDRYVIVPTLEVNLFYEVNDVYEKLYTRYGNALLEEYSKQLRGEKSTLEEFESYIN